MAEEATSANQSQDNAEPHGEGQQTDWKAKFEQERAHSREWEKRAKDNKAAADELEKLKEANMSEQQKAEARTAVTGMSAWFVGVSCGVRGGVSALQRALFLFPRHTSPLARADA